MNYFNYFTKTILLSFVEPSKWWFLKLSNGDALFVWEDPSRSPGGGDPSSVLLRFFSLEFQIICWRFDDLSLFWIVVFSIFSFH